MVSGMLNALAFKINNNKQDTIDRLKFVSESVDAICKAPILDMENNQKEFNKEKNRTVRCNPEKWNGLPIQEKALTIIHEFSHMWLKANDFCYFESKDESEECRKKSEDLSSVKAGDDSDKKTPVASAIEHYIRAIFINETPNALITTKGTIPSTLQKDQLTDVMESK